jgi:hypothetical protein
MEQNEMSTFGESMDYHPNGILATGCLWQTYHKVHNNLIPFSLMNTKELEGPCRSLMFGLHLLTHMALCHIFNNIPLHAIPLELLQILVHLGANVARAACSSVGVTSSWIIPICWASWFKVDKEFKVSPRDFLLNASTMTFALPEWYNKIYQL